MKSEGLGDESLISVDGGECDLFLLGLELGLAIIGGLGGLSELPGEVVLTGVGKLISAEVIKSMLDLHGP